MKTLIQVLILSLSVTALQSVHAEDRVATSRPAIIDVPLSLITPCKSCNEMEELQAFFKDRHKNLRLKNQTRSKIARVYALGENLASLDQANLRNPHYNREVLTYMALAAEALPYDEATEISEKIAYLNLEIGTRSHWNQVFSELPNQTEEESCRKKFIAVTVSYHECTQKLERDSSDDDGDAVRCKEPTFRLDQCVQKARNKQF